MSDRYLCDGHWYLGKYSAERVTMCTHKIISFPLHLIAFLEVLTPGGNHVIYNSWSCSHWHHMPFDYRMFENITAFCSCGPEPRFRLLEHPTDNITPCLLCSQWPLTSGFPIKGSLMRKMFFPWHRHVACYFECIKSLCPCGCMPIAALVFPAVISASLTDYLQMSRCYAKIGWRRIWLVSTRNRLICVEPWMLAIYIYIYIGETFSFGKIFHFVLATSLIIWTCSLDTINNQ